MKKFVILLTACSIAAGVMAADWPQWRGADGEGLSKDDTWSPAAVSKGKVLWTKNTGEGYSSVAVVKERVFALGNVGGQDQVLCLDAATGNEIWKYSYPCASPGRYPGPRSTPAVDVAAGMIYVVSREGEVHCIDVAKGAGKWKKSLKSELGAQPPKWAFSSSPRIAGEMLLINAGEKGVALNKKTGAKIWSGGPGVGGYSTPVVYSKGGKEYVAVFGAKQAYGVDLKTGATAWSYPWKTAYDVNAADPIVRGNEVLVSSGYGKGCALLDISSTVRAVWENKSIRSHFGGLVEKDGYVYGLDGQAGSKGAELKCVEFKTGEQKWSQKVGFGAIVGADDKIIMLTESGRLFVCEMAPTGYKEVAATQLSMNGKCWIMPVLANGRVYCRSQSGTLVCVDVR